MIRPAGLLHTGASRVSYYSEPLSRLIHARPVLGWRGRADGPGYVMAPLQERNPRHEQHRKGGQPVALPRQEYARGGVGRSICGILRSLWRPHLCLQEFGKSQGIPLSNSSGSSENFCDTARASVFPIKQRGPSIWLKPRALRPA